MWEAHRDAKRALLEHIHRHTGTRLDEHALTIGFARRATAYKRATLLFHDMDRLRALAAEVGPLQLIFAGKAHPRDEDGKAMIRGVYEAGQALGDGIPVAYLVNYDMALARLVCAGVDVWLNTPLPPLEASGTSGMKAAMNGVPSLSVLDGWWVEGHIEGVTGWAIEGSGSAEEAHSLYTKLREVVLPLYDSDGDGWVRVMKGAIVHNASLFNSHRMLRRYATEVYLGAV